MVLYIVIAILVSVICLMTWVWYLSPKLKKQNSVKTLKDLKEAYGDDHHTLMNGISDDTQVYDICKILLDHIKSLTNEQKLLDIAVEENRRKHVKVSEGLDQKNHEIIHISHQMRTSLSGLLGFTQFLQSTKLNEEQEEFVSIISISSNELLVLVNNIIDMTPRERANSVAKRREDNRLESPKNNIPFVLVVDDNDINRRLLAKVLENENLNVRYASDGKEAFDLRKEHNFDIIFMDIQMPVMDGVDSCKAIREYEDSKNIKQVPIVALTANTGKNDRDTYLDAGMTDYMAKPIMIEEVRKRIAQL